MNSSTQASPVRKRFQFTLRLAEDGYIASTSAHFTTSEPPTKDYGLAFDQWVRQVKGLSLLEIDPSWDDGPIEGGGTAAGVQFRALLDEFVAQHEG